jgi:hypothetical protein
MKRTKFVTLILGLIILLSNQIIYCQENSINPEQKICNSFIEGLEFCINSPVISFKVGEPVIFIYSIKNLTNQEIKIFDGRQGAGALLQSTVIDENGNKIPTILETLTKKLENETLLQEESKTVLWFSRGSGPRSSDFNPNEETSWRWNLSHDYDFKNKGKYFVEINKKNPIQNENSNPKILLGKIEIEIK